MKPCPVHGCGGLIRVTTLVCHSHWRMIPDELRTEIGRLTIIAPGSIAHQASIRAALDHLNDLSRTVRVSA